MDAASVRRHLATLKQGFEKGLQATAVVAKTVADVARESIEESLLAQSRTLKEYALGSQVASSGPGDVWRIYSGQSKKPGAFVKEVSIWVLDKRGLLEMSKQSNKPRALDLFFDQQRRSCQHMARLKHPGVVKVVEPLEETSLQMVLVTEAVVGSLRNVMSHFAEVPTAGEAARKLSLSALELKLGLSQVVETLQFMHAEAGLVHAGMNTQTIMLTADGGWKLAGFAFAVSATYAAPAADSTCTYSYSDPFPPAWDELSKPMLAYAAPELVGGAGGTAQAFGASVTPAADVFALALVVYELFSAGHAALLVVRNNVQEYRARVSSLQQGAADLGAVPQQLQGVLRAMLSPTPAARPPVTALASSPFFQEDVLLRALRFLDTLLQREVGQKAAFLADLHHMWAQFDDRLLRLRVLPPLIQELRSESLQASALPLVMSMLQRVPPDAFAAGLLPALQPVIDSAQGELLGALIQHGATLAAIMGPSSASTVLVPMYVRALDAPSSPRLQEDALKALQAQADSLDYSVLKSQLVPRAHAVCLRTTSGAVRAHALLLLSRAVCRLDREEAERAVEAAAQVVAVDRTASTVMCTAQLADAVSRQYGAEVTAVRLLPLLCPLLLTTSLSGQQIKQLMQVIQGMLERVQQKVVPEGVARDNGPSQAAEVPVASWDTPLAPPSHRSSNRRPAGAAGATGANHHMQLPSSGASSAGGPAQFGSWQQQQQQQQQQWSSGGVHTAGATPSWSAATSSSTPAASAPTRAGAGSTAASTSGLGTGWGSGAGLGMGSTSQQQQQQPWMSSGPSGSASSSSAAVGSAAPAADMFGGLSLADGPAATANTTTTSSSYQHHAVPQHPNEPHWQQASSAAGASGLSSGLSSSTSMIGARVYQQQATAAVSSQRLPSQPWTGSVGPTLGASTSVGGAGSAWGASQAPLSSSSAQGINAPSSSAGPAASSAAFGGIGGVLSAGSGLSGLSGGYGGASGHQMQQQHSRGGGGGDPFADLPSMALTAPIAAPVAHTARGGMSSVPPLLPPPPAAKPQQRSVLPSNDIDLLL